MEVWTPVQVTNEALERHGQAGIVHAISKRVNGVASEVEVKFDLDGEVEVLKVSDLRALA